MFSVKSVSSLAKVSAKVAPVLEFGVSIDPVRGLSLSLFVVSPILKFCKSVTI